MAQPPDDLPCSSLPQSSSLPHSSSSSEDISRKLDNYVQLANRGLAQAQSVRQEILTPRPPLVLKKDISSFDPYITERQRLMAWSHNAYGVIGLVRYLIKIARFEAREEDWQEILTDEIPKTAESSSSLDEIILDGQDEGTPSLSDETVPDREADPSWRLILDEDDLNECQSLDYYLSSLPSELLDALVAGDLPSKMGNSSFRLRISPLTSLQDRPGTYCVFVGVSSRNTLPAPHNVSDVGKCLTFEELVKVYDLMRVYIDVSDNESSILAKAVDSRFSGADGLVQRLDYRSQRRYGSSSDKDQFVHHERWLDSIREYFIEPIQEQILKGNVSLLQNRMTRCFSYVGSSASVVSDAPNCWKHSTCLSPVLGLLTAILDYQFPGMFTSTEFTYQILKTVDYRDVGLDEKLTTLLCCAYPWDTGLSTAYAGENRGCEVTQFTEQQMDRNFTEVDGNVQSDNLQLSLKRMRDLRECIKIISVYDKSRETALSKIDSLEASCQNAHTVAARVAALQREQLEYDAEEKRMEEHDAQCENLLAVLQAYNDEPDVLDPE